VALMGLKITRRGIKKALAFAGRLLRIIALVIGWFTETFLFPIPLILDMPDWWPFKKWPLLIYPPLIIGCYVFAVREAIISNYFLATVLAITGTFLIVVMRASYLGGEHEVELEPDIGLTRRAWAASEQAPADIRAQLQEIILAKDIPAEVKTVVYTVVVSAAEGKVPEVDWRPSKASDSRVEQFVTALRSWMLGRQVMLRALGNAGRSGLFRGQLMKAAGGDVPRARDMLSEMVKRREVVMRSMNKEPDWELYWLPEHAPRHGSGSKGTTR
jgi:hypothetical protein